MTKRDFYRLAMLLAIVAAACFAGYRYYLRTQNRKQAEEFVRTYIRTVEANDLKTAYAELTSERFRNAVSYEKFVDDYNLAYRKLGPLRSYRSSLWSEKGLRQDHYVLDAEAHFERDTGTIRFTLDRVGGEFRLAGFEIFAEHWKELPEIREAPESQG